LAGTNVRLVHSLWYQSVGALTVLMTQPAKRFFGKPFRLLATEQAFQVKKLQRTGIVRKTTTHAPFVCAVAILLGSSSAAMSAEDEAYIVDRTESASARGMRFAKPIVNPAPAPDVSTLVPDTYPGPYAQGVMTKNGPVHNADAINKAFGSFGIPYTATRVQDGARSVKSKENNRLSTTYPYRAVGKLTFNVGQFVGSCSASLIRKSVIVTAAHCIQNFGAGRERNTKFRFRPAHYGAAGATSKQIAPYGTYKAYAIVVPGSWSNGTDKGRMPAVDNDLAVIALRKWRGRFAGSRVGYLGYGWNNYGFVSSRRTGNLNTAAVTSLGYPAFLDRGRIMQRTDGPTYTTKVEGALQLWQGSNTTGGASGGPWIVNFHSRKPELFGGARPGKQSVMAVIGVTSWGAPGANARKDNYSSQFAQNSRYPKRDYGGFGGGNIGSLLNTLCKVKAPEGGTLKSQGYCN